MKYIKVLASPGCAMTPTHTRKRGKLYRYYISTDIVKVTWLRDNPRWSGARRRAP